MNDENHSETESSPPPIMSPGASGPDSFAPPLVTEPRNPLGWIALGAILLLMLVVSLAGSFKSKPEAKASELAQETTNGFILSLEVSQRAFMAGMPFQSKEERKDADEKITASLREPISALVEKSLTDLDASRYYAAMRAERGDPVSEANLAPLRKSDKPEDRVLAEIYAAPKLTMEQAKALVAKLPEKPFVYQLAKVHALEMAGDTKVRSETFTGQKAIAMGLGMVLAFVLILGSAIAWAMFRNAQRQGQLSGGLPVGPITLADADRLAVRAAQIFVAFLALQLLSAYLPKSFGLLFAGVGILVILPLLAMVPVSGKKISLASVGFNTRDFGKNVLWGIGGFMAELPVSLFLMLLGTSLLRFLPAPTHPVSEQLLNSKDLLSALPLVLFGSITAPLWEEFVFRGLIFSGLARVIGRIVPAAIATGFIFAMIHPQGVAAWAALACVGAIGCGLTFYTRSLVATVVMHMLHNTTMFLLVFLYLAPV